jgi:hypothetical protein
MKDFFADIRQDIKKTVRYYQQEIDAGFREGIDIPINDQPSAEGSEVKKENQEEEEKVMRFRKFISYHRDEATKAGTALYDILSHLFDAFFFVVIKRKTAFGDRHNLQKFGMNEAEVSQLQAMIHPASLSSIGTKGIPAYLLLGLQKAVSRLAAGESMVFHKKSAEAEDMDREEEQWKQVMKKSGGSKTGGSHFRYESDGMRVKSHWGNETIINNILVLFSEDFNIDEDEMFFLGVDVGTEEIVSYANFNDFVMMPILQHFINQFAQANSSTISQMTSINLLKQ